MLFTYAEVTTSITVSTVAPVCLFLFFLHRFFFFKTSSHLHSHPSECSGWQCVHGKITQGTLCFGPLPEEQLWARCLTASAATDTADHMTLQDGRHRAQMRYTVLGHSSFMPSAKVIRRIVIK